MVNLRNILCLTDFLKCKIPGKNSKNRGFFGENKMSRGSVYHFYFNYIASL
jgi:hypothetical protein